MHPDLEKLIELQSIDSELAEIEKVKGDLPELVEEQRNQIREIDENTSTKKERIQEIDEEIKQLHHQITDNQELLKKYQDQLYMVTTNKQYDALIAEIDNLKASIDNAETKILELSDEKERNEDSIKNDSITREEVQQELEKNEAELSRMLKDTDAKRLELEKKREKIVPNLRRQYLRSYERIRKARQGLAVVPVVNGTCGGCHSLIPPQRQVEIRAGNKIIMCEACGRVVFWNKDLNPPINNG